MSSSTASLIGVVFAFLALSASLYFLYVNHKNSEKVSFNLLAVSALTFIAGVFNLVEYIRPFQSDLSIVGTTSCTYIISGMTLLLIANMIKTEDSDK